MPNGIYKHKPLSEEHKRKLSEANKGHKHTEATRKKISEIRKGKYQLGTGFRKGHKSGMTNKHHSEETKKKISKARMGRKLSKEHIKKLSNARKGKVPWNKGKPYLQIRGEKNHLWKGGITPENVKIRMSIEMRLWREAVFARDNWTCQKCKIKSGVGETVYLHSHHIQNFAQYPELRFAIDNGITFCKKCHKEFHSIYGRKNNTREQLEEFLDENGKLIIENGQVKQGQAIILNQLMPPVEE